MATTKDLRAVVTRNSQLPTSMAQAILKALSTKGAKS